LLGFFACAALVCLFAYGVGLSLISYWSISKESGSPPC
jgi:hypothetical protein